MDDQTEGIQSKYVLPSIMCKGVCIKCLLKKTPTEKRAKTEREKKRKNQ